MFNRRTNTSSLVVGVVSVMVLTASMASAQPAGRPAAAESPEEQLTPQDRRMLGYARDCGARIQKVMEGWVDSNRITRDRLFAYIYYPMPDTDPQK